MPGSCPNKRMRCVGLSSEISMVPWTTVRVPRWSVCVHWAGTLMGAESGMEPIVLGTIHKRRFLAAGGLSRLEAAIHPNRTAKTRASIKLSKGCQWHEI